MEMFTLYSSQDCFKASWSSHKSVHLKAKSSSPAPENSTVLDSGLPNDGWLYCMRKGQARTPKLPHFDWTGYDLFSYWFFFLEF